MGQMKDLRHHDQVTWRQTWRRPSRTIPNWESSSKPGPNSQKTFARSFYELLSLRDHSQVVREESEVHTLHLRGSPPRALGPQAPVIQPARQLHRSGLSQSFRPRANMPQIRIPDR